MEYYASNGDLETKCINLLKLSVDTEVESLVKKIARDEPLIKEGTKDGHETLTLNRL